MGSYDNNDFLIENNLFDGHQNSEPISIYGTGRTSNVVINNNVIKNKRYGSAIYAGKGIIENITITNNQIYNVAAGIVLKANNAIVQNNVIDNSEAILNYGSNCGGGGISLSGTSNADVSNNTIKNICQNAIRIAETSYVDVHDNYIENSGYANNDFFFVNVREHNTGLKFHNNTLIRTDESLYKVVIMCIKEQVSAEIYDNNIQNGVIHLFVDSANYTVRNNKVSVHDRGTNNIVE